MHFRKVRHLFIGLFLFSMVILSSIPSMSQSVDRWMPRTSGTTAMLWSVAYGNGLFVAAGRDGVIVTSPDGITWTKRTSGTMEWFFNITYGNNMFVAVGGHGVVCTSTNGIAWTVRPSGTSDWLDGVAWGGTRFVAVGNNGTILTSTTGTTWTRRTSGTTYSLHGVVYSGNQFVAAGDGQALTSPDGVAWTRRNPNSPLWFNGIAYGNGTYVMVADYGTILTSTDGATWTKRVSGVSDEICGVSYGNGTFVAVGEAGTILTSSDGIAWVKKASGTSNLLYGVAYGAGAFVASGDAGTILQSGGSVEPGPPIASAGSDQTAHPGDMVTLNGSGSSSPSGNYPLTYAWAISSRPSGSTSTLTNPAIVNPSFAPDLVGYYVCTLIVTDSRGTASIADQVSISVTAADGRPLDSWTRRTSGITSWLEEIAWNGTTFVAVAEGGRILTSPDGVAWTSRTSNTNAILWDVAYGNGLFVTVGSGGAIRTSSAGTAWNSRPSGITTDLYGVTFGNGVYVAVGNSGAVLTSLNGVNWTRRASGVTHNIYRVGFGNNLFVAVGEAGRILTSSDGITWTSRASGTTNSIWNVTFGKSQFVAVSEGGGILTSPNGVAWTRRASGTTVRLRGVAYGAGTFVVSGQSGTILSSPDGLTWTTRASGTTLFLSAARFGNNTFIALGENGVVLQSNPVGSSQQPPVANAGADMSAAVGGGVTLNGWGSTGAEPLSFAWTMTGRPAGSGASLTNHDSATPNFSVDRAGDYIVRLVVTDAYGTASQPDEVMVRATMNPLAVDLGPDRTAGLGTNIILREMTTGGTQPYTRAWSVAGRPPGSTAAIQNDVGWVVFTPDVVGTYVIRLGMTDATGGSSADELKITCVEPKHGLDKWSVRSVSSLTANLEDLAYGNGTFAAVGAGGAVAYSRDDGLTWTRATSRTTSDLNAITFATGVFVAVGNGGTVLTSTDGINWTSRPSGLQIDLLAVAYGNARFVAVGGQGATISSTGSTWSGNIVDTAAGAAYPINLNSIVFGNGLFAAGGNSTQPGAGDLGCVLKSSDGMTWTAATSVLEEYHAVGFGNAHFLLSQYLHTWVSSDLATWTAADYYGGDGRYFRRISHANGVFFHFRRDQGAFETSLDGITVQIRTAPTTSVLTKAAFGSQHYVVVGENGAILQSDPVTPPAACTLRTSFEGTPIGGSAMANGAGTRRFVIGSFRPSTTYTMTAAEFWAWRVKGTPGYNVTAYIYADDGNRPGALLGASTNAINAATLANVWNGGPYKFTFTSVPLTAGARYWIGLGASASGDANNFIAIGLNNASGQGAAENLYRSTDGTTWSTFSTLYSVRFRTYSGDCRF